MCLPKAGSTTCQGTEPGGAWLGDVDFVIYKWLETGAFYKHDDLPSVRERIRKLNFDDKEEVGQFGPAPGSDLISALVPGAFFIFPSALHICTYVI